MIGLDTNIVVRDLTHDDPSQATAAVTVMDSLSSDSPGFLSLIVIAELVWVLEASCRFKKKEIEPVLETLLSSKERVLERAELCRKHCGGSAPAATDFADCLLERCGHAAECEHTVTFDRNTATGAGMRLLG
jgi:predicted nucleic-acid-binding protein